MAVSSFVAVFRRYAVKVHLVAALHLVFQQFSHRIPVDRNATGAHSYQTVAILFGASD